MPTNQQIIDMIDRTSEAAKAVGEYPYATGWLRSTAIAIILGYVPVANRQELMQELQNGLDYLESMKKVEA